MRNALPGALLPATAEPAARAAPAATGRRPTGIEPGHPERV